MASSPETQIAPQREEAHGELQLAGISGQFTSPQGIPELWQRFASQHIGRIHGQVGHKTYGVIFGSDAKTGSFEYMAAVEVTEVDNVSASLRKLVIPPQTYKVYLHEGHVSKFSDTIMKISRSGAIKADNPADQPAMIEYYGESFDPKTGFGDMQIWVPVAR